MFLTVILEDRTLICIPMKWCFQILVADTFNQGLNRHELHRIFYSSDATKEANFLLPIKKEFDPAQDSCYLAYTKKCFDTKTQCDVWLEGQRSMLPAVYNQQRASASAELHLSGEKKVQEEANRVFDIKIEVKKETALRQEPLRKVVKALNDLLPSVHDLTESETEDYQNALVISDTEMDAFESDGTNPNLQPQSKLKKDPKSANDVDEAYDIVTGDLRFRIAEVRAGCCLSTKLYHYFHIIILLLTGIE